MRNHYKKSISLSFLNNTIILPHVPVLSYFLNFILPTQIQINNLLVKILKCSQNDPIAIFTFKNILNTTYKYIHEIICNSIKTNVFSMF